MKLTLIRLDLMNVLGFYILYEYHSFEQGQQKSFKELKRRKKSI